MNTVEWLTQLVSFDTTSRHSNLELIQYLQDWLQDKGYSCRLSFDSEQKKANLFASLSAGDNSHHDGLILSGHTDVVPVTGQKWESDPFKLVSDNERVFGRGTADMKGFLAVILFLSDEFTTLQLKRPLHLAFSYDEEVGCKGARVLIADMQQAGFKPSACIVGEPTNMLPVIAHKGIQVFRCRFTGVAAHSSLTPHACNAIDYASELIIFIRKLAEQLREQGPFDQDFDVAFTTISTNVISGGEANNIIPERCEFVFEFRHLPQVAPESIIEKIKDHVANSLLPKMQRENMNATIEIEKLGAAPSFAGEESTPIYQLTQKITGDADRRKVAYATEAGLFQNVAIPTVIWGPGSIEQAHRPNEFITLAQLKLAEDYLRRVVKEYCSL